MPRMQAALPYPPIPSAFLAMFKGRAETVIWENPSQGIFGVVVPSTTAAGNGSNPMTQHFVIPDTPLPFTETPSQFCDPPPKSLESVVETATCLLVPTIPTDRSGGNQPSILWPEQQSSDPPVCLHGKPTLRRTVLRKDSPNLGRPFYVCASTVAETGGSCGFFRWGDELEPVQRCNQHCHWLYQYSNLRTGTPLTADEVKRETSAVDPSIQLEAWSGVQQGTERWHRLRSCRITASNFGSAHRTNSYCSPSDLLRNILWPSSMDSVAMRYAQTAMFAAVCTRQPQRKGRAVAVFRVAVRIRRTTGPAHLHR